MFYNTSYKRGALLRSPAFGLLHSEEGNAGFERGGGEHLSIFHFLMLQVTRRWRMHKL